MTRSIEAFFSITGLLGSLLLAARGEYAAWGWAFFLASNFAGITFGVLVRHWWLVLQQVGFTATSVLGIWRWLI